jgi:hypothetical protein
MQPGNERVALSQWLKPFGINRKSRIDSEKPVAKIRSMLNLNAHEDDE